MNWPAVIVVVIIVAGLYLWITPKIRRAKRALRETLDLLSVIPAGLRMAEQIQQDPDPDPKSLNGMDSVYLPQIRRDFPDFNFEAFRRKAEGILLSVFNALESQDTTRLDGVSPGFHQKVEEQIQDMKSQNIIVHYDGIHIHRTVLSRYKRDPEICSITLQSSVEYCHYTTSQGKVVKGSQNQKRQTRYELVLVYVQDEKMIQERASSSNEFLYMLNCPNCGAPVTSPFATNCEYCGAELHPLYARMWIFSDYREC